MRVARQRKEKEDIQSYRPPWTSGTTLRTNLHRAEPHIPVVQWSRKKSSMLSHSSSPGRLKP
ncbi:hypothetical protein EYF80_005891 [Liparis tanakae]|uniref:Uncharacterized protein n=1 Tax=Liparis tanakae TaxID=230148 RepID=A0A4Z2J161_9TELE|nr:hypothetical protein EYF80_005891 [Liparis tanakae]